MPDKAKLGSVFPTHVGVNRDVKPLDKDTCCIPHTRGGEPGFLRFLNCGKLYSPHTWG